MSTLYAAPVEYARGKVRIGCGEDNAGNGETTLFIGGVAVQLTLAETFDVIDGLLTSVRVATDAEAS